MEAFIYAFWTKIRQTPVGESSSSNQMIMQFHFLYPYSQDNGKEFLYNDNMVKESDNIMDKWILSFTQSLIQFFKTEMAGVCT